MCLASTCLRDFGLGSKSITSMVLSFRFDGYLTSESLCGFLSLFFPLFQTHSLLVTGVEIVGQFSSTRSNNTVKKG